MTDDRMPNNIGFDTRFGGGRLRANLDQIRTEIGDDKELTRQVMADFFALDRQNLRNHFEARLDYARQIHEHRQATLRGLIEYGLQTLKRSFLLNAGAIAVVMAYVSGVVGKSIDPNAYRTYAPLILSTWPFVVGCVCVTLAGAGGFFNFSYSETTQPSSEMLHQFADPTSKAWPIARAQKVDETSEDFMKRWGWKVKASRTVAIGFGLASAFFFAFGVLLVMHAALR
jgi:hypothetical protein